MSLFDVSEHAERLHKRAIARQELRKYPTGAPACLQSAKKGERGLK
jgi:hypothetical protein